MGRNDSLYGVVGMARYLVEGVVPINKKKNIWSRGWGVVEAKTTNEAIKKAANIFGFTHIILVAPLIDVNEIDEID